MLGLDADLATINTITLPKVEAILTGQITQINSDLTSLGDRLVSQLSNILVGALQGIQATTTKATYDLTSLVNHLDGATIEVTIHLAPEKS